MIFPNDPIAAEAHLAFQRSCTARAMVAPPNLIQGHGRRFTAKITTLSADEHGQNAASAASIFKPVRLTPALWNGGNGERVSYQSGLSQTPGVCRILQPILFDWWITMTAALLLANAAAWIVLALAMIMVRQHAIRELTHTRLGQVGEYE